MVFASEPQGRIHFGPVQLHPILPVFSGHIPLGGRHLKQDRRTDVVRLIADHFIS